MVQSDEELCRQVAEHDAAAFEALLERHEARSFRLACSILGNDSDARDVSQDAFIRLYESAGKFDGRSRFSTWFYRIVVNLCIDHKRRNKWWRKMVPFSNDDDPDSQPIDPPSSEPGPEALAIRGDAGRRLRVALEGLSATPRAAVLLQTEEDLTSREIAEILKCSESTARVHIHRALTHLKKTMKE